MPFHSNLQSNSLPCLSSWMMLLIHALQPVYRNMGIDLCRRDIRMTQNCLHSAEVGAVFNHMRGTTVAQHMRAGIASRICGRSTDHLPDPLPAEFACTTSKKQKWRTLPLCELRARAFHVGAQCFLGRLPQRHDAFLIPLPTHQNVTQFEF